MSETSVAIVGMHCRVPGANGCDELWRNLRAGVESITRFSDDELLREGVDPSLLADPDYVRARGVLDGIDLFDAEFFGYTPREAALLDPQQRLFLECAWHALEDAAYAPGDPRMRVGVFAGCGANTYLLNNLTADRELLRRTDYHALLLASEKDFLPTRVSYKLNLRGPSVSIATACSTSLVAIHAACQSLLAGECDVAIAGGVTIPVPHRHGYVYQENAILSPDGRCRAFDAGANGTAVGAGAALVVLRRLADTGNERVYAVIRGTAINNDGSLKAGFTAPSVQGQAEVIADALAVSGVDANGIGYVETHGTGTALGDPIEIAALTKAFRDAGVRTNATCAIGSIKTNIGHLDAAAGAVGLIKAALALHHGQLPPSLNYTAPNPEIDFASTPFFVNTQLRPWNGEGPHHAAVSSFGLGGTNAHAILEEAPARAESGPSPRPCQLLPLSARSAEALEELAKDIDASGEHLADIAYTLAAGRAALPHRRVLVRGGSEDFAIDDVAVEGRSVAFLFPGGGAQTAGMGGELLRSEPVFGEAIDACAAAFPAHDLRALLETASAEELERPSLGLPALFAVEYALARLWMSWGVRPSAMIGHSAGEYTAACIAGTLSLQDAMALVALRGVLFERLPAGAMLTVPLSESELAPELGASLAIAAVNGPRSCVLSGAEADIAAVRERLAARGIDCRRLRISVAAHSPLVAPVMDEFRREVERLQFDAPRLPWISNLTGTWVTAAQAVDPGYWCRHLRETVRFEAGIACLFDDPARVLLEAGPGQTLTSLALQHPSRNATQLAVPSLPHPLDAQSGAELLLASAGRLWAAGVAFDWEAFFAGERRRRVSLPLYPFQRKRYWLDAPRAAIPEGSMLQKVKEVIAGVSGISAAAIDATSTFFELGLDSLMLVQVARDVKNELGAKVSMRQLLGELSTPQQLAAFIQPVAVAAAEPEIPMAAPVPMAVVAAPSGSLERLVHEQLAVMRLQLQAFGGNDSEPGTAPAPIVPKAEPKANSKSAKKPLSFTPRIDNAARGMTAAQQRHLEALTARYTARTRRSKEYAQRYRPLLADSRAAVGFRPATKEMLYPIVGARGLGSHIWDADGNEYVDLTSGFGAILFGHQPEFLTRALAEHAGTEFLLGPRAPLTGETAELITQLTGMERVTFCNSGTEAIMAAIRIARTKTARAKIVVFEGAYHGHSDQTLVQSVPGGGSEAIAPGIPEEAVANTIVLEYGAAASLDFIRRNAHELAAVLVEPVQNMRLDFRPADFLRELRTITREAGVPLIFDEMITGFRVAPGGAAELFGVRPDLATYGKIAGGGMPIGIVAGAAELMDGIDGGSWQYGDASYPAAERTFFGGTFCQHPLTMVAAHAVLTEIARLGPELQRTLNARTTAFAERLQAYFDAEELPMRVLHFGSAFRITFTGNLEPLFFHLLEKGIYVWEWRGCFLTTAHSDADLARVESAIRESVAELRRGDFLPRTAGDAGALTPAQRQLWLLSQEDPEGALAYQSGLAIELRGAMDLEAMRRAVREVVARHESLRTVIDPSGEFQRVLPHGNVELEYLERPGNVEAWIEAKNRKAMDLGHGPLFAVHLLRTGEDRHVLVLTAHHIVTDGWSMTNLVSELLALYSGESLPKPMQFREYVAWQEEFLSTSEAEKEERYWRDVCADPPPPLDALLDAPRPELKTFRSRRRTLVIDRVDAARIREACTRRQCTLFMFLYAGYAALLHRLTGESDLMIGISTAGRALDYGESLVGYCTHVLPVRNRVDPEAPASEFLASTRARLGEAYEHQDLPYAVLLQKLALKRDARRAPLVSLTFNLDKPVPVPSPRGLEVALFPHPVHFADFDLMVNVIDLDGELIIDCDYNEGLYSAATVDRLLRSYRTLLAHMVAAPDTPVGQLPLLTAAERDALVATPLAEQPPLEPLHRTFARIAANAEVAATFEGAQLTYAELDRRANQLAHHLRARGVGRNILVAILLEPSFDMLVAILGILKAGGAYVPLDPASPPERLDFMLEDCGAAIVVTAEFLAGIGEEPVTEPESSTELDDAAYVIYTSGSTGRPKGVVVTHRNVARLFTSSADAFRFDDADVWTLFHSYAFDFSVWEIFGALLHGGRLVIVPYWITRNPDAFLRLLAEERVTVLNQTPSAFRYLIQADDGVPLAVRVVIFGGEALDFAMLTPWLERRPGVRLVNMYGITETTVHVTLRDVTAEDVRRGGSRIGAPLPDLRMLLLDERMEPVPDGVTGEIFVGGGGVARGYLHRDELNAARFLADPFHPGERLYRSGDLARRLPEGDVEYRGRADDQVKIRGFRVELGEIESVLRGHPSVRDAAVALRDGQLMAWIAGEVPERAWVTSRLTEAMVPAVWVRVESMPLTRNGKVDRAALPLPRNEDAELEYTAPRNGAEEQLAAIWESLLGVPRIGIDDDFFALGGDSILAMQVVSRSAAAGIAVHLRDVHRYPTIRTLAEAIGGNDVPLLPAQRWFFAQELARPRQHNMSLVLELDPCIETAELERALNDVAACHEVFRFSFDRERATMAAPGRIAVADVDLSALDAAHQDAALRVCAPEIQASFATLAPPLVSATLFRCGAERPSRLLLVIHHLCVDGVSWRVLLEDLERALAGERLADVPVPLSSYARALAAASFEDEVPYWQALADRKLARLPFDGTAPDDAGTVAGESHVVTGLDADVTSQLLQSRVDDVLLAALAHALAPWAAGTLLVDVETHGRDLLDLDLSRTVGWLTAIHPLPLESGHGDFAETIGRIRAVRDGVPRGGAAYLALRTAGRLDKLAQAGILFNYLGQLDRSLRGRFIRGISTDGGENERARENRRTHALEINAYVRAGALTIDWAFDRRQLLPRTVERLAAAAGETLRQFAATSALACAVTEGVR